MPVFRLTDAFIFPEPHLAREDGLLAVGGDLLPQRLLLAYQMGIFPWYSPGEPILWWAPDPRLVLFPHEFRMPKRLARTIRQGVFHVTMDQAFSEVIEECSRIRTEQEEGTWIDEDMIHAYNELHDLGYAHSVECWRDGNLAGGVYGVSIGKTFFGESMFSRVTDSSKVALATLVQHLQQWEFDLIDCQVRTDHLIRLGAREIAGADFQALLEKSVRKPTHRGKWQLEPPRNGKCE